MAGGAAVRPPRDLKLPDGWRRTDYYIGTRTDTWRVYVRKVRATGVIYGELWRMTGKPHMAHLGSIESCIEFARGAK